MHFADARRLLVEDWKDEEMKAGQIIVAGPALGSEKFRPWLVLACEEGKALLLMLTSSCNKDNVEIRCKSLDRTSYPAYEQARIYPVGLCSLFPVKGEVNEELVEMLIDGALESLETPDEVVDFITEIS